jgi:dolichyl-phosphate-mannose--protein O-mannosyl transferase
VSASTHDSHDSHDHSNTEAETIQEQRNALLRRLGRWKSVLPLFLIIIAMMLYLPRLDYPEKYLFDEILFAYTAGEYVEGNPDAYLSDHPCSTFKSDERCVEVYPDARQQGDRIGKYQWDHPPLGKMLIAIGILVFGNDAFGWRIASAIMGAFGLVIMYQLGVRLSGRVAVGFVAALLLLLDGLYFIYSRMGLVDIFVTVLTMSALFMFSGYLLAPPDRMQRPLFLTGWLLGMGIATKWNAAFVALFIGIAVLVRMVLLFRAGRREGATSEQWQGFREHLVWVPLALGLVPLCVYILTYAQFFLSGYSVSQFVDLQINMFNVHSALQTDYDSASRWWEWPLALEPVWFGNRTYAEGGIATIYANGNPFLYWAFLPAMTWLCFHWLRTRNPALIVIVIGFFGQWLPWIFVGRETFVYHFLPAMPFGCLAVAMAIVHLFQGNTGWRRTIAIQYVVLVVLAFVFFYPVYSYLQISEDALALRMWFPSWRR